MFKNIIAFKWSIELWSQFCGKFQFFPEEIICPFLDLHWPHFCLSSFLAYFYPFVKKCNNNMSQMSSICPFSESLFLKIRRIYWWGLIGSKTSCQAVRQCFGRGKLVNQSGKLVNQFGKLVLNQQLAGCLRIKQSAAASCVGRPANLRASMSLADNLRVSMSLAENLRASMSLAENLRASMNLAETACCAFSKNWWCSEQQKIGWVGKWVVGRGQTVLNIAQDISSSYFYQLNIPLLLNHVFANCW